MLTAGHRHEQLALPALLSQGQVARTGPGRPRLRPDRLAGDKGYSSRAARCSLRQRGIRAVIPRRVGEPIARHFDQTAYRKRNRVERLIGRFKEYRAIATRYDKLGVRFYASITLAAILIWL